jgi:hypothetical protein
MSTGFPLWNRRSRTEGAGKVNIFAGLLGGLITFPSAPLGLHAGQHFAQKNAFCEAGTWAAVAWLRQMEHMY